MRVLIRQSRQALSLSQIRLARIARMSPFKLKQFELGNQDLTQEEILQLRRALEAEGQRVTARIKATRDELEAA